VLRNRRKTASAANALQAAKRTRIQTFAGAHCDVLARRAGVGLTGGKRNLMLNVSHTTSRRVGAADEESAR
jgi:hypothetical protein